MAPPGVPPSPPRPFHYAPPAAVPRRRRTCPRISGDSQIRMFPPALIIDVTNFCSSKDDVS